MSQDPNGRLDAAVAEIADLVVTEVSLEQSLERVVVLCQELVTRADSVGITLITDGRPVTSAATDDMMREIDRAQYASGSGPCLEACDQRRIVAAEDLRRQPHRWPAFTASALERGTNSVLSFPLEVSAKSFGALNTYSRGWGPFAPSDIETGGFFAARASVALANAHAYWTTYESTRQVQEALATRDIIDQAKGILIAQRRVSDDEAFDLLRRASQRSNRKLGEVAQEIVDQTKTDSSGPDPDQFGSRSVHQATGMVSVQMGISVNEALNRLVERAEAEMTPVEALAEDVVARRVRFEEPVVD
jgi:GAF domain-containing protein